MRTINEEYAKKSIHPDIFEWRGIYKKVALFYIFFSQRKIGGGDPGPLACYDTAMGTIKIYRNNQNIYLIKLQQNIIKNQYK